MKKLIPSLVFVVCTLHLVHSQWVYQQVPSNASHYITLEFPNTQIGAAGGTYIAANFFGRAAFTTNAGTNWNISQVPDSLRVIIEIKFVNITMGYCVGAYNIGNARQIIDHGKYDRRTYQALPGITVDSGDYKGIFLKSTNSGQSWFTFGTLPSNVYYVTALYFVNSSTAFAVASYAHSAGMNDGIIKSTNAGQSWTVLTLPETINNLDAICFTDMNSGFAVGFDVVNDTGRAVILKTTNSGLSWSRQIFMQMYEFTGVHFTNSNTGLVVGGALSIIEPNMTKVYRTTNAGVNWSSIINYEDIGLYGTRFVQGTGTALIYGMKSIGFKWRDFIAKTTNYGGSWTECILNDTGLILFDSELLDQNNWYLAGGDLDNVLNEPVILHTTNGGSIGITQIGGETPIHFSLYQNYPNPFNPSTKIRFDIPPVGAQYIEPVQVKVYDLLGCEVATLVNEQLKPGTYEVEWNGNNFASGVYFYKLITRDFIESKKMILIR